MGIDEICSYNEEAITLDGLDDAIIGMAERINLGPVVAYDVNKIIDIFVEQGMTHEEALEYFSFNVSGAWLGEFSPVFIHTTEY